jgi:hypothetical protein
LVILFPTLSSVLAHLGTFISAALGASPIVWVQQMTALTMGLVCIDAARTHALWMHDVFFVGNNFQVGRIDAGTIAAFMVNDHSGWNRPVNLFVGEAMGIDSCYLPVDHYLKPPIAIWRDLAYPLDAAQRVIETLL